MKAQLSSVEDGEPSGYRDNHAHLVDELRQLDLCIQNRIRAFRLAAPQRPGAAKFQFSCITHEEVNDLLRADAASPADPQLGQLAAQLQALREEIDATVTNSLERGIFLALPHLALLFGLSAFEARIVVICLAPELRRKYDKLYAYLQDDITRKRPSIDLALRLLCETEAERWRARVCFSDDAPLIRMGLLHKLDDPQSPSGSSDLASFLKLDPRILDYLLGNEGMDARLTDLAELRAPLPSLEEVWVAPRRKTELVGLLRSHFSARNGRRLVVYLRGPYGVGKRQLALGLCGQFPCPLLYLDLERLVARAATLEETLRLVFREAVLQQAALYLDHADGLLGEEQKASLKTIARLVDRHGWLTFVAGTRPWSLQGTFESSVFQSVELPVPEAPLRELAWQRALADGPEETTTAEWAAVLARRYRLTPGQIQEAADEASHRRAMTGQALTLADLGAACCRQSQRKLRELAVQIEPRYGWEDLVLPADKLAQLKEICSQVEHGYRVFGEWGFARKLARGRGLSMLFSGPPGTGKTMAAEVIARELLLDLYKIDLSGVVSKYIGETEKNLSRIFQEAEASNAILFFDEADALFGKRTEVSDAHDRYANIETSYLLQKMEEYQGIVILATNLYENMDEAFRRRLRFIVDFPFPDVSHRQEIWRMHFPLEAPVGVGIDYEFLARHFQIAGGNIRNIVLNAAFLAAQEGGKIEMGHILHGTRREFEKIGKLWTEVGYSRAVGQI